MFFIGPSVNIFVYLLVSAFFVVCFYSKSEIKITEALPGYESVVDIRTFSKDVYFYGHQVTEDGLSEEKEDQLYSPEPDRSRSKIHFYITEYKDPNLCLNSLRAPPVA